METLFSDSRKEHLGGMPFSFCRIETHAVFEISLVVESQVSWNVKKKHFAETKMYFSAYECDSRLTLKFKLGIILLLLSYKLWTNNVVFPQHFQDNLRVNKTKP